MIDMQNLDIETVDYKKHRASWRDDVRQIDFKNTPKKETTADKIRAVLISAKASIAPIVNKMAENERKAKAQKPIKQQSMFGNGSISAGGFGLSAKPSSDMWGISNTFGKKRK
jgi:sulfite reductase alpha subunit-like flavoprotein